VDFSASAYAYTLDCSDAFHTARERTTRDDLIASTHAATRKDINGKGGGEWREYPCHSHLLSHNTNMPISMRSARLENAETRMATSNMLDLLDSCSS
jgi:hypothetical protein